MDGSDELLSEKAGEESDISSPSPSPKTASAAPKRALMSWDFRVDELMAGEMSSLGNHTDDRLDHEDEETLEFDVISNESEGNSKIRDLHRNEDGDEEDAGIFDQVAMGAVGTTLLSSSPRSAPPTPPLASKRHNNPAIPSPLILLPKSLGNCNS